MAYWRDRHNALHQVANFTFCRVEYGGQHFVHGMNYFGEWASCILGPDIGGTPEANNPPNIAVEGFDQDWVVSVANPRPPLRFNEHRPNGGTGSWVKGHLLNGGWGGPGTDVRNLTPLTVQANNWHRGIESGVKRFLYYCHTYDDQNRNAAEWYGVWYKVARSRAPIAAHGFRTSNNLFSYAPSSIGVAWRAIRMPKPTLAEQIGGMNTMVAAITNALTSYEPAAVLPPHFNAFRNYVCPVPLIRLQDMGRFVEEIEDWETNANNFDNTVEVHNVV